MTPEGLKSKMDRKSKTVVRSDREPVQVNPDSKNNKPKKPEEVDLYFDTVSELETRLGDLKLKASTLEKTASQTYNNTLKVRPITDAIINKAKSE